MLDVLTTSYHWRRPSSRQRPSNRWHILQRLSKVVTSTTDRQSWHMNDCNMFVKYVNVRLSPLLFNRTNFSAHRRAWVSRKTLNTGFMEPFNFALLTNPLQWLDQKPGIHCHRLFETLNPIIFSGAIHKDFPFCSVFWVDYLDSCDF